MNPNFDTAPPTHLADKYNVYFLRFNGGSTIFVHVSRPVSFKMFIEQYLLNNIELTIVKTDEKIKTNNIVGVEKVLNTNIPEFELTMAGNLIGINV